SAKPAPSSVTTSTVRYRCRRAVTSCAASGNMPRARRAWFGIDPMRAKPLSAAELAQIPEFVERWTQIGLSTTPIDHEAAEPILHRLYAAAGLTPPQIVWAPCPMTAVLSAIVYTGIRASGREAEAGHRGGLANIV